MRILRRPMFRKGGSANEGIMHGLDRKGYSNGSEWENTTQSEWEDIAKAYQYGQGEISSTDYQDPKNIEKWSEPISEWWHGTGKPETLIQSIYTEAAKEKRKQDLLKTEMEKGPPGGTQLPYYKMPPPRKKPPGTTGGAEGYPEGSFEARKNRLSERAKEYTNLMHPMAKERLIAGSLAAASESFEKSTGNTKQDIARAISAAAKASDPTEMYSLGARLALQEDIQLRGIREAAKAKSLYRDYAPSEKIKSFNELKKYMSEAEAIDRVFGENNIYANVAEASSKEVGVPESSINIAAGQTYKEDYKRQVEPGDWEEFKDTAEDGVYKVGKKIYRVQTVEGKKKITVEADFASTKI